MEHQPECPVLPRHANARTHTHTHKLAQRYHGQCGSLFWTLTLSGGAVGVSGRDGRTFHHGLDSAGPVSVDIRFLHLLTVETSSKSITEGEKHAFTHNTSTCASVSGDLIYYNCQPPPAIPCLLFSHAGRDIKAGGGVVWLQAGGVTLTDAMTV